MTWRSVDIQEQRVRFVVAASRREKTFGVLCQEFEVSRPTGYLWLRRYQEQGLAGIAAQPSAACQSAADRRRVGAAGGGTAATLSGLGSAQTAGATSAGGSELAGEHHSSHSIASGVGADRGSACGGVAALRAGRAQPTLADGFQRLHGVGNGGGTVVGARRSQPLSDRPARDLDDESRTRAGAAGIGLFGVWRAGGDADGSWHAVEERKRADGGELADGVVDAARHRVALERIPASANPGESGTFSWLAATGARTAGRARRTTAAVARSVSPRR